LISLSLGTTIRSQSHQRLSMKLQFLACFSSVKVGSSAYASVDWLTISSKSVVSATAESAAVVLRLYQQSQRCPILNLYIHVVSSQPDTFSRVISSTHTETHCIASLGMIYELLYSRASHSNFCILKSSEETTSSTVEHCLAQQDQEPSAMPQSKC